MSAHPSPPPRRALRASVVGVLALLPLLPALLAASPAAPAHPAAPAPHAQPATVTSGTGGTLAAAPAGTTVMIIRHGEKPPKTSSGGVGLDGRPDEHSLTAQGWTRAVYLVDLFAPVNGPNRAGLPRPRHVYAAGATEEGTGLRTRQTVGPLAVELKVPVVTKYGKGNENALVAEVATLPGPTLICWQHSEIPAIAAALGTTTPAAPTEWPADRYDMVWSFTATGTGWRYQEIPEMLLPGDRRN